MDIREAGWQTSVTDSNKTITLIIQAGGNIMIVAFFTDKKLYRFHEGFILLNKD
jgi:hypothetical protein